MDNLMDEIQENTPEPRQPDSIDALVIYGGPVYDGKGNVYKEGSIYIENNVIRLVGEEKEVFSAMPKNMEDIEVLNANGKLALPGLINTHHQLHNSFRTGLTPLGPTENFSERLENFIYPYEKSLNTEGIQLSSLLALMESIKSGVTTIFDLHSSPGIVEDSLDMIGGAFDRSGVRGALSLGITDMFGEEVFEASMQETKAFIQEQKFEAGVKAIPGLYSNLELSEEALAKFAEAFDRRDSLHIQIGQNQEELNYCQELGYKGPAHRLDNFGLLTDQSILAHGGHLTERDIEEIQAHNSLVSITPVSDTNDRAQNFDLQNIDRINTGFGTTGLSSDLLNEIRTSYMLWRSTGREVEEIYGTIEKTLFQDSSQFASRVFDKKIGILESGAQADIALMDYEPATLIHSNNISKHLIHGLSQAKAETVIIDGDIVYKDKAFLTIDQEIIKKEASKACQNIWENYLSLAGEGEQSPEA